MPPHDALTPGHGPHGFEDSSLSLMPFLGGFLLVALLVGLVGLYLWRSGKLTWPLSTGPTASPEDTARQILAERYARGDISSDDFLERASILNWTPGSDAVRTAPRLRRR